MLLRWFEHSRVYFPSREMNADGAGVGRSFEDVFFTAGDGVKLNGWYFAAETNSARASMAILLCHGNGGNISHRNEFYRALLETGVSVFAFDYRGYGRSAGRPSEAGTYQDGHAAYRWLREKGFAARNILIYGESLGGGIASELALREETGGLILQSTFTSLPDIGAELYPWLPVRLVSSIKYNTHGKLPNIHVPVLILHSRTDSLIAFHHAEQNFAAANEPKLFQEINGGHNDPLAGRAAYLAGIEEFLRLVEQWKSEKPAGAAAR